MNPQNKKTDTNEVANFGSMTPFNLRASELIGRDVDTILRTAVHGKRIVAAAGTHHRIVGRLEVDESATRDADGWLPASIVMYPCALGPHDAVDFFATDADIDADLNNGTTQRVRTKVRLDVGDNYDTFVTLAVPRLGGKRHGLPGWTCYSPGEVRWQIHRDPYVTLHLMSITDVIHDIRASAEVLSSRLHNPESRDAALPLARNFAGRVARIIGETIEAVGQRGSKLEAQNNTYHYGWEGAVFGSDDDEVYLSYHSRRNPEADEVIWAPWCSEAWTPDLGDAPLEALTVYGTEEIIGDLMHGTILDDMTSHLDCLTPFDPVGKFDSIGKPSPDMDDVRIITDEVGGAGQPPATPEDMQAVLEQYTEGRVNAYWDTDPVRRCWEVAYISAISHDEGWDILASDEDDPGDIGPRASLKNEVWMQRRKRVRRLIGPRRPEIKVRHVVLSREQVEIVCLALSILSFNNGCGPNWELNMTREQQHALAADAMARAHRLFDVSRDTALDILAGVPGRDAWFSRRYGILYSGTREERRHQLDCLIEGRWEDLVICNNFCCELLVVASDPYLLKHPENDAERIERGKCGTPRRSYHDECHPG